MAAVHELTSNSGIDTGDNKAPNCTAAKDVIQALKV